MSAFYFYIRRLALAFWLGMMLFFSTIVAPTVFKVLPKEYAGDLQAALFPLYYKAGLLCALVIAFSIIVRARIKQKGLLWTPAPWETLTTSRRVMLSILAVTVLTVIFAFCLWIITPKLSELREQMKLISDPLLLETLKKDFSWFHKVAVFLNGFAILLLLVLLGFF